MKNLGFSKFVSFTQHHLSRLGGPWPLTWGTRALSGCMLLLQMSSPCPRSSGGFRTGRGQLSSPHTHRRPPRAPQLTPRLPRQDLILPRLSVVLFPAEPWASLVNALSFIVQSDDLLLCCFRVRTFIMAAVKAPLLICFVFLILSPFVTEAQAMMATHCPQAAWCLHGALGGPDHLTRGKTKTPRPEPLVLSATVKLPKDRKQWICIPAFSYYLIWS